MLEVIKTIAMLCLSNPSMGVGGWNPREVHKVQLECQAWYLDCLKDHIKGTYSSDPQNLAKCIEKK